MADITAIRAQAEAYYRQGEFYCSEAVLKAVLEGLGESPSHEMIAMASGFPVGIGGAECTCGALSGAVMAVGYFFGRSTPKSKEVGKTMALSRELHNKFKSDNKYTCCRALTRDMTKGSELHMAQCIKFTGDMAQQAATIICRNLER